MAVRISEQSKLSSVDLGIEPIKRHLFSCLRQFTMTDPSKISLEIREIRKALEIVRSKFQRDIPESVVTEYELLVMDCDCLEIRTNIALRKRLPPPQISQPSAQKKMERRSYPGFVGIKALKAKQAAELANLTRLSNEGKWESLQVHRGTGFDWWMFPIDYATAQNREYRVTASDIEELKQDLEFMTSYRKGVILVAKSWGWDLEKGVKITDNPKLKWSGYQVRLGKMLDSLQEFGQKDLHDALVKLIKAEGVSKILQDPTWHVYLTPIH